MLDSKRIARIVYWAVGDLIASDLERSLVLATLRTEFGLDADSLHNIMYRNPPFKEEVKEDGYNGSWMGMATIWVDWGSTRLEYLTPLVKKEILEGYLMPPSRLERVTRLVKLNN